MKSVRICLPATSANLGAGFDTLALALELFLEIDAELALEFSITATGRNAEICGVLENNLLFETYRNVLTAQNQEILPLSVRMQNGIPLGMGCGSSAAVRLAGVALAAQFGRLGWSDSQIVDEAARIEGHPDNVAGCWYGGLTIVGSSAASSTEGGSRLTALTITPPSAWRALLVLPEVPVSTAKSRSVLPESYSRKEAVVNVQNASLLTAAFSLGRADLLSSATVDCMHQPYRMELCPLLPALLPLSGRSGVASVTLSGAGPAVLLLGTGDFSEAKLEILALTKGVGPVELIETGLASAGANVTVNTGL